MAEAEAMDTVKLQKLVAPLDLELSHDNVNYEGKDYRDLFETFAERASFITGLANKRFGLIAVETEKENTNLRVSSERRKNPYTDTYGDYEYFTLALQTTTPIEDEATLTQRLVYVAYSEPSWGDHGLFRWILKH